MEQRVRRDLLTSLYFWVASLKNHAASLSTSKACCAQGGRTWPSLPCRFSRPVARFCAHPPSVCYFLVCPLECSPRILPTEDGRPFSFSQTPTTIRCLPKIPMNCYLPIRIINFLTPLLLPRDTPPPYFNSSGLLYPGSSPVVSSGYFS